MFILKNCTFLTLKTKSFIHFCAHFNPTPCHREAEGYSSCHRVKGGVHPGQDSSLSRHKLCDVYFKWLIAMYCTVLKQSSLVYNFWDDGIMFAFSWWIWGWFLYLFYWHSPYSAQSQCRGHKPIISHHLIPKMLLKLAALLSTLEEIHYA